MHLNALLAARRSRQPERPALECGETGRVWSYAELHSQARSLAGRLLGQGVGQRDRVVIWAANSLEYTAALLALWLLGAVAVPVNPRYRRRELEQILRDCTPSAVLLDSAHQVLFNQLGLDASCLEGVSQLAFGDLAADCPYPLPSPAWDSEDTALILYTSGTTGRSKGAMISHNNVAATVAGLVSAWGWQQDDVLLLALPLFHVHGLQVGLLCALTAGATAILNRSFEAASVLRQLQDARVSLFFAVPTMYFRLMRLMEEHGPPDLRHLRLFCSGSAPLAAEDHRRFRQLTGHVILERYGMTETGMNYSNPLHGERVPGTVGLPLPGVSGRIVDASDKPLPAGQEGHLQVRGSNVISAYWNAPPGAEDAFVTDENGIRWFRTGDIARVDPNTGYLTLLGRSSECILSGGFNIYPREVEDVLLQCPGVQEAAVVGRPHAEWGEAPIAFVTATETFDAQDALDRCRFQLAGFKVPKEIRVLPKLPRNALGKLQKFLLPRD